MKKIVILNKYGKHKVLVDNEDFEKIKGLHWYILYGANKKLYVRTQRDNKTILLHRFLLQVPKGLVIDHINGNGLDNRKKNIRICTQSQNMMNTRRSKNNKSGHKGIDWNENHKKWRAQISLNRKQINLGWFDEISQAVQVYNEAVKANYKEYGRLNFI